MLPENARPDVPEKTCERRAGTLVVLGGALHDDNDNVWRSVVEAAGGPGARLLIVPTASTLPERSAQLTAVQLERRGAHTQTLPIAPHWPGSNLEQAQEQVSQAHWLDLVERAQGIWFTGGEQEWLIDTLRPQGVDSPLLAAIRDLFARGGVVAGTSAGAAVMSETAIRRLDDPFSALLRPLTRDELDTGFGLAPHEVVTDQHFLKRGRVGRLARVVLQSGRSLGIGVEENSAARLHGTTIEAIGARGLVIIDATQACVRSQAPLHVEGLRLSYIDRGDRFDLVTRRVEEPETRRPLPAGAADGAPAFFGDILGDNIIVGAMAWAAEATGRRAIGLAWRLHEPTGFEWRLDRDEQTRAWGGKTRDEHTFEGLRLDIKPVRMAQPVYAGAGQVVPPLLF